MIPQEIRADDQHLLIVRSPTKTQYFFNTIIVSAIIDRLNTTKKQAPYIIPIISAYTYTLIQIATKYQQKKRCQLSQFNLSVTLMTEYRNKALIKSA